MDNSKQIHMMKLQQEAKSKSIGLSKQAAPSIFSLVHQTVHKHGTKPSVIITDPAQIKQVFNKNEDFLKPKIRSIAKYFSIGLPHHEGEKWAKHRKIINPAFHVEKLKVMLPAFFHSCNEMISKWKGLLSSDGTCEIDVCPFLQNLSCDVISRTAFGSSYEEGTKIFELLKKQGYLLMTARHTNIPLWRLLPTTTKRKMEEIETEIHDSLEGIIKKREKALENGENTNDDLLGILLQSNLAEKQVRENSRYPEWQERARQEVLQVFGNQTPNFEGLSQLKIVCFGYSHVQISNDLIQ
ncbi:11-oxo-beta-amyrin 30-oxidase [Trifolium repens]|nr:11-oxo-beta-amyrin 30-oxidase [Trifolium repens]